MKKEHFAKLERMYLQAKVNTELYEGSSIHIGQGTAEIKLNISDKYFHAGNAIHGSVYFKLIDDASYFAVSSILEDVFLLTTSFHIQLLRPVKSGSITAVGSVKFRSRNLFVGEATLYDQNGKELAFGCGNFSRSKSALTAEMGYK